MDGAALLYDLLPEDGEPIGFEALKAALSERTGAEIVCDELFRLIGHLQNNSSPSRGVRWSPATRELRRSTTVDEPVLPFPIAREIDLEPWFERFLWLRYSSFYEPKPPILNTVVQHTARRAGGSGRWTRPDLCMACVAHYRYTAVGQLDLFSFELKLGSACNILSVHEALAHGASSHFAYLALHLAADDGSDKNLAIVLGEAQRHGVGVIRIVEPREPASFKRLLEARRNDLPPARLDDFILQRFDPANRVALERWVRAR